MRWIVSSAFPNTCVKAVIIVTAAVLVAATASAQLAVSVSPPKVAGNKAVVKLELRNAFAQKIESARAVCFLTDEQGKTIGPPTTRWVIGGNNTNGLPQGATNTFHFVIASEKPFTGTNLTAAVMFSRVVLEGGRLADVSKDVRIESDKQARQ